MTQHSISMLAAAAEKALLIMKLLTFYCKQAGMVSFIYTCRC